MSDILNNDNIIELPVVPLRGLVVFPNMVLHFDVGRKKSVNALKSAMQSNQQVFLVCQRDASVDEPALEDMFGVGVICQIEQMIRIPGSNYLRVVVEGKKRAQLQSILSAKPFLKGAVTAYEEIHNNTISDDERAYVKAVKKEFERYASLMPKISSDVITKVISIKDTGELVDFICSNTFLDYIEKQDVLSALKPHERLLTLFVLLKTENSVLEIESELHEKVQQEIDKSQREYYLREEMKVISDTLGESENPLEETYEYKEKILKLACTEEVRQKLTRECERLMKMPPGSHEATVVRGYLDKCLEIPFGKYTKNSINIEKSRRILDRDHYGLEKVKERVIDSLAVYKRNPDFKGQIICLAGPPGVGKTSIVKSLAAGMNRKYVRIALGGIHDEAEIRGHRKTYIGSMPGRIIDAVIKSGVMNPIILLDEIDKLAGDYKGDPSSALLEALDPEQNNTFTDHFIEFPVDLSRVMFITTANDISSIPAPLYDRMEVIELSSYTAAEKFNIAKKHLIKKELEKHGLSRSELKITDSAIDTLIECYTKEAGVRGLQKQIAALCRKAVAEIEENGGKLRVTDKNIEEILGKKRFLPDKINNHPAPGIVNGLAWTSVGGTMLPIEVSAMKGTGKIELTGNLGNVMKESARTAVTYVRSRADYFGIDPDFYKNTDIHIHAPEGAVPKDGPSAGLAIATAVVSELTAAPVKASVAMTGEISLKGRAMAIGGLKEKSMAAYKAGCDTVIIPADNMRDLAEISDEVKNTLEFIGVDGFDDIIPIAFDAVPKKQIKKKKVILTDEKPRHHSITQ